MWIGASHRLGSKSRTSERLRDVFGTSSTNSCWRWTTPPLQFHSASSFGSGVTHDGSCYDLCTVQLRQHGVRTLNPRFVNSRGKRNKAWIECP